MAKEWESEDIEKDAEILDEAGLKPPDFMPVAEPEDMPAPPVIDASELLWSARVLASLVRVHRNVIPAVRDN